MSDPVEKTTEEEIADESPRQRYVLDEGEGGKYDVLAVLQEVSGEVTPSRR